MLQRVLSMKEMCRRSSRSAPYIRALAAAGVLDCYVSDVGSRTFPMHADDQLRAHEAKRNADEKAA